MATITANLVKDLREKTGVGMMQCKKALAETNGDMDLAVDLLRKQGAAIAAKRADKDANEGKVFLGETDTAISILEFNCETDFVGGSDDFVSTGEAMLQAALQNKTKDVDSLKKLSIGDLTVESTVNGIITKLGENISVKRIQTVGIEAGEVTALYSHMGGKIGVALKLKASPASTKTEELKAIAKDLAMQVAATNPVSITEKDVPESIIAKEREIYRDQAIQQGTKEDFLDRVIDGRVKKFLKEVCLQEQVFVKDSKVTINQLLAGKAKEFGLESLEVSWFCRFELGKS